MHVKHVGMIIHCSKSCRSDQFKPTDSCFTKFHQSTKSNRSVWIAAATTLKAGSYSIAGHEPTVKGVRSRSPPVPSMDPSFSPTTKGSAYHPRFSFDDISLTSSTTDEFFDTNSFISNPSLALSQTNISSYEPETINSYVGSTTEANRAYHSRFSSDDINITSSTSDRLKFSETDSFMYGPSLASSQTSIASYKTVRSITSRKSRYNTFLRHKYAGAGQSSLPSGPASLDVDSASVIETELMGESDGTIKTVEFEAHQRRPSTSTSTEREPTIDDIIKTVKRFCILSVGRSGVGKSTLITSIFGIDASHVEDHKPGEADVQQEFASSNNPFFFLHDSKGFEPGDLSNFDTVREFIRQRSGPEVPLGERIHGLWLCTETPTAGGRVFETGDEKLLQFAHKDQVPIVVVFTQYDRLVRTKEAELREDHPHMDPTRLRDRGVEEAQKAFQDCLESLKRTMNRLKIPMPRYAKVSVRPGHQEDALSLVKITRDVVRERVKGDAWVLWVIAQRESIPVKIDACVTKGISYYSRALRNTSRRGAPESGLTLLHDCIRVVHKDIITCWNFKGEVLNSPEFRQLMLRLVQDIHTKPNTILPNVDVISQFVKLATASAPIVPPVAILGLSYTFVEWLSTTLLEEVPSVQRLLIAYVVDLVGVLRELFDITLRPDLALTPTWKELQAAFESYERSYSRQRIHNSIYSNTMRGQQMTVDNMSRMISPDRTQREQVTVMRGGMVTLRCPTAVISYKTTIIDASHGEIDRMTTPELLGTLDVSNIFSRVRVISRRGATYNAEDPWLVPISHFGLWPLLYNTT
ncbi:hypothetical protein EDB86DRAFT_3245998 [Lactarius hatsudake]|nr:hypothetical protein EDB86DRAFT_3245998 [Lactarius hatsudake]